MNKKNFVDNYFYSEKPLHIGIACNRYDKDAGVVEQDLMSVGKNIEKTLCERGYRVTFLDFNHVEKVLQEIQKKEIDLVFNVCERVNNNASMEPHAAAILDIAKVPYTGSGPLTLSLCVDKIKMKKMLSFHKIPTAKWDYAYTALDDIKKMNYPLIVKPASMHNSIGISNESVVQTEGELRTQIHKIITEFQCPVVIEEYLEGDEYGVAILGNPEDDNIRVLPLSSYHFENLPREYWNICAFDAKWVTDSVFDAGIHIQRGPKISKKLEKKLIQMAIDTYTVLDCRDYGRVDIKLDKNGNPYVLELNPNPSINMKDCAVTEVAKVAGLSYSDLLEEIIRYASTRNKVKFPQAQPSYALSKIALG